MIFYLWKTVQGAIPPQRFKHTACMIDGKMYVYGGINSLRRDLFLDVFDLEQRYWERPLVRGHRPNGVQSACCCLF